MLGVSTEARQPGLDAPTLREGGMDCVFHNWCGVFAPPGLPEAQLAQLDALVGAMAASREWAAALERRGWQPIFLGRRDFAPWLSRETEAVRGVLRELGLAG